MAKLVEANKDKILEVRHLSKSFGNNNVLKNVYFSVPKGTVLGLMGENGAGKSTLMKCLFGMYSRDNGLVFFDGLAVDFKSSREALENGMAMVHQELNQCVERSIQDNLFLGKYITNHGIISEKAMYNKCLELFHSLDMNFNPKTLLRTLSVSERQMVEIAKAVSYNAKLVVLDEPTSSLSEKESEKLFRIIDNLKKKGVGFVFISHKMNEIFEHCDNIVVLRDGEVTLDKPIPKTNLDEVVKAMIGRNLESRFPEVDNKPGDVVLRVKNLSTRYKPRLRDISFELKKGEILGVYGLVGSGRSKLLDALFGRRTVDGGSIYFKEKRVTFNSSKDAIKHNFAYVTEERKVSGIFPNADLTFNTCITCLDKYKGAGGLIKKKMHKATDHQIASMRVKCIGRNDKISSLSGGNQQKIILAKWMERNPDILILDEPTRGIDIMAKYQIYELIIELAKKGKSIIMSSSEMPEILGVTNRILVMSDHRVAGVLDTKSATQEQVLRLCGKYIY